MDGITTALGTAFSTVSTNVNSIVAIALPVAIGIVGTFLAVKLGIKFFKSVTGK